MFRNSLFSGKLKFRVPEFVRFRRTKPSLIASWIPRSPVLGLEIRGNSLSLACFKLGLGRVRLALFGKIPDFAALSPQDLHTKLKEFLKPLNGEEPVVALALPRSEAIVRPFHLPAAARKSLDEAIKLQVEIYKPTDSESVDWDSTVVEEEAGLATALVLSPHSIVERLAVLFSEAGYPITRITLSQFALLQLLLRASQPGERVLLFDCRDGNAELAFLEGKKLASSRTVVLQENSAASQVLGEIRKALSLLRWGEDAEITVVVSGNVSAEVEEALSTLGSVERLGDKISLKGLSDKAGFGAHIGAACAALSIPSRGRQPYCINLLSSELRPVRRHLRHLPTYALLAANALLLLCMGLRIPVQNYLLVRQYRSEIAGLKAHADEMKGLLQKEQNMQKELVELDTFQQRGRQPLDALNEVAQKLPQDAWLNVFSYRKGQVELSGSAKAAAPLLPLFQSTPLFQEVKFAGALSQDSTGAERFRLQIRLRERP